VINNREDVKISKSIEECICYNNKHKHRPFQC